jgi:signal transduction histidine kinase
VVLAALLMTGCLAWRRAAPLAAALVSAVAFAASELVSGSLSELVTPIVALVAVVYSAAAHLPLDRAVSAGLAQLLGVWLSVARDEGGADLSSTVYATVVVCGAWALGRPVHARQVRLGQLEVAADRHADDLVAAATRERARLSHDLHDMLGHSLTVMVVQAGAAEEVLRARPADAAQALATVRETGRRALDELRRTVAVLQEPAGSTVPDDGLDDLATLADRARAAGLQVELSTSGALDDVPPGAAWCVHRVVQEALTNVLRHAGARSARVEVAASGDVVRATVDDDGCGPGDGVRPGVGLTGMRERVEVYGGTLDVGPSPEGGLRVHAVLPLDEGGGA